MKAQILLYNRMETTNEQKNSKHYYNYNIKLKICNGVKMNPNTRVQI